jgi:YfiH family protein
VVCAVLTADCLPLLLCNRSGSRVAAVHAGWRGLLAGVVESTLDRFAEPGEELLAWLGPAIGPTAFEVGEEVREAFLKRDPADESAFLPGVPGHWLANIYRLAENRLNARNIGYIGGGDHCTLSEPERFFSYRRDGVTGRMASLIWIE